MNRKIAIVPIVAVLLCGGAVSLVACSSSYEAGSTAEEQLCDVLEVAIADPSPPEGLAFEPLLEGAATDPSDMPSDLLAVALAYRTNEDAYDLLGPYEPAIAFAANLVYLSQDDLIGPSDLSPTVLDSAMEVDAALAEGACG
jgi:hypothetical protein